jgi:SAM-dependent methyltransferase
MIETASGADAPTCRACGDVLPAPTLEAQDRLYGVPGTFEIAICARCGAGTTLPIMTDQGLGAFYPEHYGAYEQAGGPLGRLSRPYHAWRDQLTRRTPPISILRARPAGRLLDVGSGKGEPGIFAREVGWEVVGVDPSPAACEIASRRGIDARLGMLSSVELDDVAPFDAIMFHHSLEHVESPHADLQRARSLIAADGVLLISVPNFDSWQVRRFGVSWYDLDVPRHRSHFTHRSLGILLQDTGFEAISYSTQSTVSALPVSVLNKAFGRYPLQGALRRLATIAFVGVYPIALAADRFGGGDIVTVLAEPR